MFEIVHRFDDLAQIIEIHRTAERCCVRCERLAKRQADRSDCRCEVALIINQSAQFFAMPRKRCIIERDTKRDTINFAEHKRAAQSMKM